VTADASFDSLTRGILRVGGGRGFVVKRRVRLFEERIIITAAHCIEHARRLDKKRGLPSCHPWRFLNEQTYPRLLGPLGAKPTVWATCLFVDPIADIAVLGQPDNQALSQEADAYDRLVESMATLAVVDAPAQGVELLTFSKQQVENPTPGEGPARVLSLDGHWREGRVRRFVGSLAFEPEELFEGGMSGSPIVNMASAAIGVCSSERINSVIVDSLSAQIVREILPRRTRRT
jgi:hypothetical protein